MFTAIHRSNRLTYFDPPPPPPKKKKQCGFHSLMNNNIDLRWGREGELLM